MTVLPQSDKSFLTGIQPSGALHIGNYFGSILPNLQRAEEAKYSTLFLADLHALNSIHNKTQMRRNVLELAAALLACGLDPNKTMMFAQSAVPAHTQLMWILSTLTPMGLLERSHSYKDKKAKGQEATAGLFTYPVLMAADILLYSPDVVPVGKDQKQHLEIARDLSVKFNAIYGGSQLKLPEPMISEDTGVVPGIDGEKMSKSYGNTIPLFCSPSERKKRVMQIVTDSKEVHEPKDPHSCNVFALAKLVVPQDDCSVLEQRYKQGGMGYGEAKTIVLEAMEAYFAPMQQKYDSLIARPEIIMSSLQSGAEKANLIANRQLEKIYSRVGLG